MRFKIFDRIKNFFKTPFKKKIFRNYGGRWFSFFNKDLATNETIFSAVSMRANAIASAPVGVYLDGRKLKPSESGLAALFKYGVNHNFSTFDFIKVMEVNRCTKGAAYAILEYNKFGEVTAIWPMNADYVEPQIEDETNELYYQVNMGNGMAYVHSSNMIALTYLTSDGITPINPLNVLKNTIDFDRETKEFSLNQMKNGLKANYVVKIADTKLSMEDLDEYDAMMQRMKENGVIYVDAGKEFQELKNGSYIDPNLAVTEQITVERVERVFNMVGKLTKGSTSNSNTVDTEDLLYLKDAVLPTVRQYEQEFTRKCLRSQIFTKDIEIKFTMNGFGRATMEKRGNFYQQMIRSGIMTQNEIRALEDLPRVEGGDVLFVSRDMCPSDMIRDLITSEGTSKGGEQNE